MPGSDSLPNTAPIASVLLLRYASVDATQVNKWATQWPQSRAQIAQLQIRPRSAELSRVRFLPALIVWPWPTPQQHSAPSIADLVRPPAPSQIWERWTRNEVRHLPPQPTSCPTALQTHSGLCDNTAQRHFVAGRVDSAPGATLSSMQTVRSGGPLEMWSPHQVELAGRVASTPTRHSHHLLLSLQQPWWHSGKFAWSLPSTATACSQSPHNCAGESTQPRSHIVYNETQMPSQPVESSDIVPP